MGNSDLLNREGKIVYGLNSFATLFLIICCFIMPNTMYADRYSLGSFFIVSALLFLNLCLKSANIVWVYHVYVTAFILLGSFLAQTKPVLFVYLVIAGSTLFSWTFNKNHCYLTHMSYNNVATTKKDSSDGEKHFVRTPFISKYKIDYAIIIILMINAIRRLMPNCQKKKNIPKIGVDRDSLKKG